MASQSGGTSLTTEPKGYPLEIFRSGANPKYVCWHCNHILKNPVQNFCGHRTCKICIEYLIRNNNTGKPVICKSCIDEQSECEESQLKDDSIFPDNAIRREMASQQVYCSFTGCSFSGIFKEYEQHYEHCEFLPVLCSVCSKSVARGQLASHTESEHIPTTGVHLCPLGCGQRIDLADLISHATASLSAHLEAYVRWKSTVDRKLNADAGQATVAKSEPSVDQNLSAKWMELDGRLRVMDERIRQLAARGGVDVGSAVKSPPPPDGAAAASSDTELGSISEKLILYEGVITVMNREIEKLTVQSDTMERQRRLERELVDTVDRKMKTLERELAVKVATIAELELKVTALENTSYDGTLLWRIADFARRRQEAVSGRVTSIYSPPFYTSRTGYKMCVRLYLNGDGMGKGTHVSLFFVVMRGSFDALLKWPFHQKVTLMFLDQNGREHVVDAFRPDPTSSSFRRPTSEMNIASGCPLLMPLTTLDSGPHAYVKDNTAFIKIIVSLDDLTS